MTTFWTTSTTYLNHYATRRQILLLDSSHWLTCFHPWDSIRRDASRCWLVRFLVLKLNIFWFKPTQKSDHPAPAMQNRPRNVTRKYKLLSRHLASRECIFVTRLSTIIELNMRSSQHWQRRPNVTNPSMWLGPWSEASRLGVLSYLLDALFVLGWNSGDSNLKC